MSTTDLELRVAALERQVQYLTAQNQPASNKDWVLKIWGSFAGDSEFKEASDLGRKWRKAENQKSLRRRIKPTPKKKTK